jgi:thiol-disulfide isomerase/thioredoxin
MRGIILIALLLMSMVVKAQTDFDTSTDKENGSVVFKGQITYNDLRKEPSFKWLDKGIVDYKPNGADLDFLGKHLKQYEVVTFMGTWCEDSQNLVPKLLKVLAATDYPMHQHTMYGVDRTKMAKYTEAKFYEISRVPTFILIKDNQEVGRITESVNKSIEVDLKAIIEKDLAKK